MSVSNEPAVPQRVRFDSFVFEFRTRTLGRDDEVVELPPRALEVLACLLERPGEVVSKHDLFDRVWDQAVVMDHSLTEAVRVLRVGLGDDARAPRFIQTVPRRGYRFIGAIEDFETAFPAPDDATLDQLSHRASEVIEGRPVITSGRSLEGIPARVLKARFGNTWRARAMLLVAAVTPIVVAVAVMRQPPTPGEADEVPYDLAEGWPIDLRIEITLALSPDGRTFVFASAGDQPGAPRRLLVQRRDARTARSLPGTDYALFPSFSPDGTQVVFFAPEPGSFRPPYTRLMSVPIDGSEGPTKIADVDGRYPGGASWGDDDTIVFAPGLWGGLRAVSAAGGSVQRLTEAEGAGHLGHVWPDVLPGGRGVLFTIPGGIRGSGPTYSRIGLLDAETGSSRVLVEDGAFARYSAGHIIFARNEQLVAMEFDLDRMRVTSREAVRVRTHALTINTSAAVALSDNDLLFVRGPAFAQIGALAWVDRDGDIEWFDDDVTTSYGRLTLSPAGDSFAAVTSGLRDNLPFEILQIHDLDGTVRARVADEGSLAGAVWTTGASLAYAQRTDRWRILHQPLADALGPQTLWEGAGNAAGLGSISPDGRFLAFVQSTRETRGDIALLDLEAPGAPAAPFRATASSETSPAFSPDGRLIAFESRDTATDGKRQVFVAPFGEGETALQVSTAGGERPVWQPGGRRLYYKVLDVERDVTTMMAATLGPAAEVIDRQDLFSVPHEIIDYDVHSDGRFLMALRRYNRRPFEDELQLVLNWPGLLAPANAGR